MFPLLYYVLKQARRSVKPPKQHAITMFYSTSPWGGFPFDVTKIIKAYERGEITLAQALNALAERYDSKVGTVTTSRGVRAEISFGTPCIARFVF